MFFMSLGSLGSIKLLITGDVAQLLTKKSGLFSRIFKFIMIRLTVQTNCSFVIVGLIVFSNGFD